jgi:Papain family cysteine protease
LHATVERRRIPLTVRHAASAFSVAAVASFAIAACQVTNGPRPLARAAPPPPPGYYVVPQSAPPPAAPPPPMRAPTPWQRLLAALPPLPAPPSASAIVLPPLPTSWTLPGLPTALPAIRGWPPPATPPQPKPTQPPVAGAAPTAAPPGFKSCGLARVGNEAFPIDCVSPTYALIASASSYLIPRQAFAAGPGYVGAEPLPQMVDHRTDGTEGPIRDQGRVGACTGFSLAAALDHALSTSSGRPGDVSVMQVWARYHFPTMGGAIDGNRGQPLGVEPQWPYNQRTACEYYSGPGCDCGMLLGVTCDQPVDKQELARLNASGSVKLTNVTRLPDGNLDDIKAALAKGQDVWFGMYVDDRFQSVRGKDAVVPDGDFRAGSGGHAMVIAGYRVQSNGTYYLLHNSWGTQWGDHGYAWIYENTLRTNLQHAYVVDVSTGGAPNAPSTPNTPGQPTPPAPNAGTCPAGTVPDSGNPVCLPPCPDGSPRHFNTCPTPGQCPRGEVNLFGFCVTSPVSGFAQSPSTGIRHVCGPGGCTYFMPRGVAGCTELMCMRSCPAPKYLLTIGPAGLGCSA